MDKEIFELQQAIKIKQAELDGSDSEEKMRDLSTSQKETKETIGSGEGLNETLETIKPANNASYMQIEEELSFD